MRHGDEVWRGVNMRWVLLLHLECLGIDDHQVGLGRALGRYSYS